MQSSTTSNLWQTAYGQLDEKERDILSTEQAPTDWSDCGNHPQSNVLIDKVILLTEKQYEEYQQKDGKLRQSCQKIINAPLSFKDIVSAVAAAAPTHLAATAWTIVSLGLTIAQNHNDRRDALFESSEYLADVLTQCAFIEENFYIHGNSRTKNNVGTATVKVRKYIGRKLLDCVAALTEHPLKVFQDSVETERKSLREWIEIGEYLNHREEAEKRLCNIDQLAESMKELIQQFNLVNLYVADGAFYDSYVNEHEDFCLPDTRTKLLSEVSQHRQLVSGVLNAINNDPHISSKYLSEQFDKFLLQPLLKLHLNPPSTTVFVVDALDECDRQDDMRVILHLLPQLQKSMSLRVRIFLTSRPELPIRLGFKKHQDHRDLVLHELPRSVIEHDIRLFFRDRLARIRDEDDFLSSIHWPGEENIEKLLRMCVPLFIFAATLCHFIGDQKRSPQKRLATVLQSHTATSASQMKSVYEPVLKQILSPEDENESRGLEKEFCDIVGVIVLLASPLPINALGQLLLLPNEDIGFLLNQLHSVLSVPQNTEIPVRILHLSFRDYLVNTTSTFHVDEKTTHAKIASRCLRVMENSLKHNICGLASYGTQRMDIDSQVIKQHISPAVEYSCRYWVYHLQQSKGHILESKVLSFLKQHFLHWLEALSLIGIISEAVGIIDTLNSGIWRSIGNELSHLLNDARRFILKNVYIASLAPLQLYCSGLIFSPMQSTFRKMFSDSIPEQFRILPQVENIWSPGLQTLEGHAGSVGSVTFSPDGQILASASSDSTIKLWNTKTSSELQTLIGHAGWIRSVTFSPDGQILASASDDSTVKLWDAKTGSVLQTFEGHAGSVGYVAFSPNGQILASAFSDSTIKLWNTKTNSEVQALKGHTGWIRSVAFSPDEQTLASASDDSTIKLWDAKSNSGQQMPTLRGYASSVCSVAFSPDGQILASTFDDSTIKLWDAKTGSELQTPIGHTDAEEHTTTTKPASIPQFHYDYDRTSSNINAQISVSNNWVVLAGENLLWLPPEHRQFTTSAIKDTTITLGYSDGRISIIGFRTM
ncbi:Vegetative incompatibility protein HET-E-1 [Talaromyces islandicus]|uniref:Vegetative incompatibility protein HET-E-1 n=1 Tax=Talaromyces islandicus TaxID=28573 RepID=A0A0U1M478_TALIS|nr:Vegetative incompatibility protein HET-E-1 [Talaromyces islandicus]